MLLCILILEVKNIDYYINYLECYFSKYLTGTVSSSAAATKTCKQFADTVYDYRSYNMPACKSKSQIFDTICVWHMRIVNHSFSLTINCKL